MGNLPDICHLYYRECWEAHTLSSYRAVMQSVWKYCDYILLSAFSETNELERKWKLVWFPHNLAFCCLLLKILYRFRLHNFTAIPEYNWSTQTKTCQNCGFCTANSSGSEASLHYRRYHFCPCRFCSAKVMRKDLAAHGGSARGQGTQPEARSLEEGHWVRSGGQGAGGKV